MKANGGTCKQSTFFAGYKPFLPYVTKKKFISSFDERGEETTQAFHHQPYKH